MTVDQTPLPYQRDRRCPFDPAPELRALQAAEPVTSYRLPNGRSVWLITRHDHAREVLGDAVRFSSEQTPLSLMLPQIEAGELPIPPGNFVNYDPPRHTRMRKMLVRNFTARRMQQLTPRLAEVAEGLLDEMERTGPPADLVEDFALPIALLAISELLGIPLESREEFVELVKAAPDMATKPADAIASYLRSQAFMARLVAANRAAPNDGMVGALIAEHGDELDDQEIIGMSLLMLAAGVDTASSLLGMGALALLQNPEQAELFSNKPDNVDNAVQELVRYLSVAPAPNGRTATQDVTFGDTTIKAGDHVLVTLSIANRDPQRFPHPDRLDLTRDSYQNVSFGHGIHHCLGAPLAAVELRVALTALFRRMPGMRLAVPFEEITYSGFKVTHGAQHLPVVW